MLAETGNASLRLGRIGEPLQRLQGSEVVKQLRAQSDGEARIECARCPYHTSCGPDPVQALADGRNTPVRESEHCRRSTWTFRHLLERLDRAAAEGDETFLDLAYAWARREHPKRTNRPATDDALLTRLVRQADSGTPEVTQMTHFKGIPVRSSVVSEH